MSSVDMEVERVDIGRRTGLWLMMATGILVLAAAGIAVVILYAQSEEACQVQVSAARFEASAHRVSHAEWEAIAVGGGRSERRAQVGRSVRHAQETFDQLIRISPESTELDTVTRQWAAYASAVDKEMTYLGVGQIALAERTGREQVQPSFDRLLEALIAVDRIYARTADRKAREANLGSGVMIAGALIAICVLLWRFDKARRDTEVAVIERQAIGRSEEHFRKLIQLSSDVTMILKPNGTISYASASADRTLGYSPEYLVGTRLAELIHEDEAVLIDLFIERCLNDAEGSADTEFHFRHGDGGWCYLGAVGSNRLDDPAVGGIIMNVRDITERKRMEEELAVKNRELETSNSELSALYGIAEAVSGATDTGEVLARAFEAMIQVRLFAFLPHGGAFVVEGDRLKLAYYRGNSHTKEFLKLHDDLRLGECLCGLAAQTGEVIISKGSAEDGRHTIKCPEMPDHGHVIVPLKSMGKVIGVMYLYRPAGAETDESAHMVLRVIGDRVGTALENVRLYEKTRQMSLRDPLTGLANRRMMHAELEKSFARARRLGSPLSLVMLDLDHFKHYNDMHGHAAGDKLLADIAGLIQEEIREVDLAVRYGGEEFLLILPDTEVDDAANVAERLRVRVMETDFYFSDLAPPGHVTISPGVVGYDGRVANAARLVQMADEAMYTAKKKGRNRVEKWAA